jgi:uncharacterized protein (TIGR00369 family)
MSNLDKIQSMIRGGEATAPPVASLIGFRLTAAENGAATVVFQASKRHWNPMGTLHGGILCDIADAAMGIAYATLLAEGETFTTLDLNINFLKPIWEATLSAEARVVKSGRTVGLVECDVFDEKRSLVARASSTCMTLRGKEAEGR